MTWALGVPVGGNLKVVLLGIANHAHPDGTEAYPALDTLAEYACCDRSTARRNQRKLIEGGWIVEDGLGPKGQHRFRLPLDRNPRGGGKTQRVAPAPERGGTGAQGGVAPVPPKPSNEPSEPSTGESAPARGRARAMWKDCSTAERAALTAAVAVVEAKGVRGDWKPELVVKACRTYEDRDVEAEAEDFRFYWIEGRGENRPVRSPAATWRNWLKGAPTSATRARLRGGRGSVAKAERDAAKDEDVRKGLAAIERMQGRSTDG